MNSSKNTLYNTYGTFFYFLCQWLITVFVVRIGNYHLAGVFSLVVSITNVFYCISLYGVRNYQVSDIKCEYSDADYFTLRTVTSIIGFVLFFITIKTLHYDFEINSCCIIYMLYKIEEAFSDLLFGFNQKYDKYKNIAISYTLKGVATLVLFIVTLYCTKDLFKTIISNVVVYFTIMFLFDWKNLRKNVSIQFKTDKIITLLKICFPLMLYICLVPYLNFITRYFVELNYGTNNLGYYSSVTMIVSVLSTLTNSVFVTVIPKISNLYYHKCYNEIRKLNLKTLVVFMLLLVFVMVVAIYIGPFMFKIVFGKEILNYMYLLPLTVLTSFILSLVSFSSSVLISFHKNMTVLLCNLTAIIVCTLTIGEFIKLLGMNGSLMSMFLSLLVSFVLLQINVNNVIKLESRKAKSKINGKRVL